MPQPDWQPSATPTLSPNPSPTSGRGEPLAATAPLSRQRERGWGRGCDSARRRWPWLAAALALFVVLLQLGNWQVRRLAWKQDLIARVDARVHADPTPAPGVEDWPHITRTSHEYLRITVQGRWLPQHTARVQATTALGAGYWVLTPLQRDNGEIIWVNRGFVPPQWRAPDAENHGTAQLTGRVTGLLRLSEPNGAFLRNNDPNANRWHSRDIAALSAARGLPPAQTAPYFVDAATSNSAADDASPTPGLTVIHFANNHLVYAITWYGLALGLLAAVVLVWRLERRRCPPTRLAPGRKRNR